MTTSLKILKGDCRKLIKQMPDRSVQCIVTSPPYWGLRSYLPKNHPEKHLEIGQEKTPQEYVRVIVEIFRDAKRILKDDGTVWLNLGDSYNHKSSGGHSATGGREKSTLASKLPPINTTPTKKQFVNGLKEKDLVGIPWRVAFALQEDGWHLRSDIIWHKPNPMPESVKDRPTRAHEYIFLLSKSEKYFYDSEAIREKPSPELIKQIQDGYSGSAIKDYIAASVQDASAVKSRIITGHRNRIDKQRGHSRRHAGFNDKWDALTPAEQALCGCNKRDVWTVAPANYKDAHFATFPPKLIEPCILAGSRIGDTVLDPFGGSGVVPRVALEWNRNAVVIELNDDYIPMIKNRTQVQPQLIY